MKNNKPYLADQTYKDIAENPGSLFIALSERNFYATKQEMQGTVRNPFTNREKTLVKIAAKRNIDPAVANRILNTMIFHHKYKLSQPFYSINTIMDKGNFAYVGTKEGILSIYVDRYNKEMLVNANDEIIKVFNNRIDYKGQDKWKPMALYSMSDQIKKQIEFLSFYAESDATPKRYVKEINKLLSILNERLKLEEQKLINRFNKEQVEKVNRKKFRYDKIPTENSFEPFNSTKSISIDKELIDDLDKSGYLTRFINDETLKNNQLTISSKAIQNKNKSLLMRQQLAGELNSNRTQSIVVSEQEITKDIDKKNQAGIDSKIINEQKENKNNQKKDLKTNEIVPINKKNIDRKNLFWNSKDKKVQGSDEFIYKNKIIFDDNIDADLNKNNNDKIGRKK